MSRARRRTLVALAAGTAASALTLAACTAPATTAAPSPTSSADASACVTDPKTYTEHRQSAVSTEALPADLAAALDAAAVAAIASTQVAGAAASTQAPGTTVAVRSPEGTWMTSYGVADLGTGAPMTTDLHHRIASVTKSFTATVVLQLAAENELSLTDAVGRYLPDVPRGDEITLGDLITMRSGIRDYFDTFLPEWISTSSVAYTADQMLAVGFAQPPLFEPDAGFDYSNSNYLLLGQVIEKVTGTSLEHELDSRIIGPLGLSETSWPGDSAVIPDPHARGYSNVIAVDGAIAATSDGSLVDTTDFNPSWAGAAGEMIGTAADLLTYGRALGTGEGLLSESAQLERLSSFQPGWTDESQYGQGMSCRSGWVGHGGDTLGFHTDVYYNGEIDTTIVVLMNRYPSSEPQAVVTALAAALGKPIAPLE